MSDFSADWGALRVPRPDRSSEYRIAFAGARVEKGWNDCLADARNAMVDAWERLTEAPGDATQRQYQLRGDAAFQVRDGQRMPQWEYKITDGGRVFYLIDERPILSGRGKQLSAGTVIIIEATPGHPKRTEKVKGSRKGPGRR